MKNEIKKEWGTPKSNIQLFVPQEYCASCTKTEATGTIYFDFINNGKYDLDERCESGWLGQSYRNTDFGPAVVKAYQLTADGVVNTQAFSGAAGLKYDGTESVTLYEKTISFRYVTNYKIQIESGKVYTLNAS